MKWLNIIDWPRQLYEDIRQWLIVRSALKESETISAFRESKYELRIDKIGRIYTVINIPEELLQYEKQGSVWPWVVEQLRDIDDILLRCQLSDLVFPEVTQIKDYPAYLVILSPSTDSLSFSKFISWIFRVGLISFLIYLIDKICISIFHQSIIQFFSSLF